MERDELTLDERTVLAKVPASDAYWTSDIAHDARMPTPKVRRILMRLENYGEVQRVVKGNPTSWRRTP